MRKIPPFRDAHMHFMCDGRAASEDEIRKIIAACRKSGIFAVRDMGHRTGAGLDARRISAGALEIRTAGFAISRRGSYGTFLGRGVAGEEELRAVVREVCEAGADFIKVINSGIVAVSGAAKVTEGGFTLGEMRVICEEAREKGLRVACHANSERAIRDAVSAGVSSIEHGFFISGEAIEMMAESGVSWTPTAYALLSLSRRLSPHEKRKIEEVVERHLSFVSYAASAGVRLNAGTDSGSKGVCHGDAFFEELRLFQRAGLTLEEILSAACINEAAVEKGNFLVVEEDFISTGRIEAVYIGGRPLSEN